MDKIQKFKFITLSSLMLACLLVPSSLMAFIDVDVALPESKAISELRKEKIISGYPDGTFKPDQLLNRAEAVKILLIAKGATVARQSDVASFKDLESDAWYLPFIETAQSLGLVKGYDDGTFRPQQNLTLAEALKLVVTTLHPEADLEDSKDFELGLGSEWYSTYFNYAYESNLLDLPDNGQFDPKLVVNRSQFANLVYRAYKSSSNKPFNLADSWELVSAKNGLSAKKPTNWSAELLEDKLIIYRRDARFSQALNSRVYPRSAHVVVEKLKVNPELTQDDVFAELKKEYEQLYPSATFEEKSNTLVFIDKGLRDLYVAIEGGKFLVAQASYGTAELNFEFEKQIKYIQSSITEKPEKNSEVEEDFIGETSKEDVVLIEPISLFNQARQLVLSFGEGATALKLFPDLEKLTESVSDITGKQVVYYYSAVANLSLKYEPTSQTLLGIKEGKFTSF